jgi:hypothetical protein
MMMVIDHKAAGGAVAVSTSGEPILTSFFLILIHRDSILNISRFIFLSVQIQSLILLFLQRLNLSRLSLVCPLVVRCIFCITITSARIKP